VRLVPCVVDNDDDGTCANRRLDGRPTTPPDLLHPSTARPRRTRARSSLALCPNYCSSASTSPSFEFINRVQLNTLDNTPAGTPHNNYIFYNLSTNVGQTNTYPVTVTITNLFSADRCTVRGLEPEPRAQRPG
jgi:hypothetical protein